jgi:phosphoribosyl-AMP cyclohydrolase
MSENLLLYHEAAPAGANSPLATVLDGLPWDESGLVAAVAQQHDTGEVLMLAWMNRAALEETLATGRACYWSRSRRVLWRKGETSGCTQAVREVLLDCDGDAVLLRVDQKDAACHTGRRSCFYNRVDGGRVVVLTAPPEQKGVSP